MDIPGSEDAMFIDVTVWEKQAETCAEALRKGSKVAVEGSLRSENWTDKDGNERSKLVIRARSVDFMSPRLVTADDADHYPPATEDTPRVQNEPDQLPF